MGNASAVDTHGRAVHDYVQQFVDGLVSGGVRHACVCPGSRSTPLALALWRHPAVRVWMHLDERSCGFFALGLAKARGAPVALLCTSGSAASNFGPAVAEAAAGRVPLVVLTSDRPHELRNVGANQAMDQNRLFGAHSKLFVEMALPEGTTAMLRYAAHWGARAAATAIAVPAGAVHLNLPLREPLLPVAPPPATDQTPSPSPSPVSITHARARLTTTEAAPAAARLANAARPLIVCGPQTDTALGPAVARLAEALDAPVLADPLSQVRRGAHAGAWIVDTYDAFLRTDVVAARLQADVVLRLGATPTSKALLQFLDAAPHDEIRVVDAQGWNDPALTPGSTLVADGVAACDALADALADSRGAGARGDWPATWRSVAGAARAALQAAFHEDAALTEPRVAAELGAVLPAGATLFAGNSMPVRDIDTFLETATLPLRVLGNRGLSGIDGVVSSALGVAAANAVDGGGPLALLVGDLSFYHDLNGLLAARQHAITATLVVINNDGGGIFSFLPQAQALAAQDFEALFGTPHGLSFRHAAELYGLAHTQPDSVPALRAALTASLGEGGVQIIEVRTDRAENVAVHRRLLERAAEAAQRALADLGA